MKDVTTGTETRESRELHPEVRGFDLTAEIDRLRSEPEWREHGKASKTLAKAPAFRIVLTLVAEGGTVGDDDAWSPLAVQVLEGEATATREGVDEVEIGASGLAWFSEGAGWLVRARRECVLLISMSWPQEMASDASDQRYDHD